MSSVKVLHFLPSWALINCQEVIFCAVFLLEMMPWCICVGLGVCGGVTLPLLTDPTVISDKNGKTGSCCHRVVLEDEIKYFLEKVRKVV